ncbi:MAG: hypothetical protein AAGA30_15450 [Planctomycetota bacterium]
MYKKLVLLVVGWMSFSFTYCLFGQTLHLSKIPDDTVHEVRLLGNVEQVNKYSFAMNIGETLKQIEIGQQTKFYLKCSSPRVDFDELELKVTVEGRPKSYQNYPIKLPLYLECRFQHRKQLDRVMAMSPKRLSQFRVTNEVPVASRKDSMLFVRGQLLQSQIDRQLLLKVDDSTQCEVRLSKEGLWGGFNLSDLERCETKVLLRGTQEGDRTIAREIVFWPFEQRPEKKISLD